MIKDKNNYWTTVTNANGFVSLVERNHGADTVRGSISDIITWVKPPSKLAIAILEEKRLSIAFWFVMNFFGWRP